MTTRSSAPAWRRSCARSRASWRSAARPDGRELDELLGRTGADVVVLDRYLEDEDGLELCRELRARPDAPEVLLYTASTDADLEGRPAPPARSR